MSQSSYQDQHLDLMIEMAFAQLEAEEIEQLINEPDPVLNPEEAARADRAFQLAMSRSAQQQKAEKRAERKSIVFTGLRYAATAVAAIFILALIALPVTFAASAEFRQAVMKLFVQIDEERGEAYFSFQPEETSEEVQFDDATAPDFWKGFFFPQYLPEGFSVTQVDELQFDVTYTAPDGRSIRFTEAEGSMPVSLMPEDAEYHESEYGYNDWAIWEEDAGGVSRINIYQEHSNRYCRLTTLGLTREEALKIAGSVRDIMHDVHYDPYQRGHLPPETEVTAPDYWTGDYYITWMPEGLWRDGVYSENRVQYQDETKRAFYLDLYDEEVDFFMDIEGMDFEIVPIHGWDAYLLTDADEELSVANLYWQEEDVWFSIYAYNIPVEQVLKMAESTERIQRDEGFDPMAARRIQYDERGRALPCADWRGEYFPGWLPEDCILSSLWNHNGDINFSGSSGREVGMTEEMGSAMTLWGMSRYTEVKLVQVNSRQGLLLVDDDDLLDQTYSLYWDDGNNNWIELFGRNVTEEELMRVAQSIYRVSTGEKLGAEPRSSYEETAIAVPDCWNGNYYPAYVPEEFEVLDYVDFFHSIELVSEDNRRILFSELDETVTSMRGTEGATVDTILIQGKEATIIDGWHNNIHNVTIVWSAGDNKTWFDLVTYGMETEETIQIAESVRKL